MSFIISILKFQKNWETTLSHSYENNNIGSALLIVLSNMKTSETNNKDFLNNVYENNS